MGKSSYKFRCLPLAIGCYRYILVVHPSLVMAKPTLLRLVSMRMISIERMLVRIPIQCPMSSEDSPPTTGDFGRHEN